MNGQRATFPFRRVLPAFQLLICLSFLWPSRHLLFQLARTIESYAPPKARSTSSPVIDVEVPSLTPEQQEAADRAAKLEDLRLRVPVMLNFPVLIPQLPYILVNSEKREWVPRGMLAEVWRALSWPFAGILFWWCAGRGIEALRAAGKAVVAP